MDIVWALLCGAVAGWLAGNFSKGSGFGLVGNIIVGILGGAVGGIVFPLIGIHFSGTIGVIIQATAGALGLFFVLGLFLKKKN
ncbi:MAG: GlsB/YeaQ/YmgE family stress response membrane protein [Planctomycetota bacterium]|nr:GlsB/YeaQ/YmgE family stress response membrane protein [Planctomycetota bacterium]